MVEVYQWIRCRRFCLCECLLNFSTYWLVEWEGFLTDSYPDDQASYFVIEEYQTADGWRFTERRLFVPEWYFYGFEDTLGSYTYFWKIQEQYNGEKGRRGSEKALPTNESNRKMLDREGWVKCLMLNRSVAQTTHRRRRMPLYCALQFSP